MPKQWPQITLAEILTERNETPDPALIKSGNIPIISKIRFSDGEIEYRAKSETNTKMILIHPGDLVLSGINAMKGAIAIYNPVSSQRAAATIHYAAYKVNKEKADIRYLWWLLRSQYFQEILSQQVPQGIKTELKAKRLMPVRIPLPSITEQQQIVGKINVIAGKVQELNTLQNLVVKETIALWASLSESNFNNLNCAHSIKLGEICEVQGGLQKSPLRLPKENPVPYLTVAHVQRNYIDFSIGLRYFEVTKNELDRLRLIPGDLLIIEGNGSLEQIGRVAIFNGEIENCVHQNHIIRARPNRNIVSPEYLNVYLNSPSGQVEVQKKSRTTSGLRTLSVGKIKELEIPLPPILDQQHLVRNLTLFKQRIDQLQTAQIDCINETGSFLPAYLNKVLKE